MVAAVVDRVADLLVADLLAEGDLLVAVLLAEGDLLVAVLLAVDLVVDLLAAVDPVDHLAAVDPVDHLVAVDHLEVDILVADILGVVDLEVILVIDPEVDILDKNQGVDILLIQELEDIIEG